jgi:3-methylfumaryl-CoA hydratase
MERIVDTATPELIERFNATFDFATIPLSDKAPLGLHWCLAQRAAMTTELGSDGHPRLDGSFLPPVPLPRRMWAGSNVTFCRPIKPSEIVERISRIANIEWKVGRSGPLCFVTVEHTMTADGEDRVCERQDLVYRGAVSPGSTFHRRLSCGPVTVRPELLFRYSALTFNSHRIHYDHCYARDEEGYPDIVVQGPLQATLLLQALSQRIENITWFSFRAVSPLFLSDGFRILVTEEADHLIGRIILDDGTTTMEASAK